MFVQTLVFSLGFETTEHAYQKGIFNAKYSVFLELLFKMVAAWYNDFSVETAAQK